MQYPGIQSRYTYWCLLVNRLYNKLLVIERDVSDFAPREPNLWSQSGKKISIFKGCCKELLHIKSIKLFVRSNVFKPLQYCTLNLSAQQVLILQGLASLTVTNSFNSPNKIFPYLCLISHCYSFILLLSREEIFSKDSS